MTDTVRIRRVARALVHEYVGNALGGFEVGPPFGAADIMKHYGFQPFDFGRAKKSQQCRLAQQIHNALMDEEKIGWVVRVGRGRYVA